ncbi:hypothetical protein NDI43_18530 [Microcoleus vaginatus GB2-A3]
MERSDHPLGLGMRKAIALLVIWGKRAIALLDEKGDRTLTSPHRCRH